MNNQSFTDNQENTRTARQGVSFAIEESINMGRILKKLDRIFTDHLEKKIASVNSKNIPSDSINLCLSGYELGRINSALRDYITLRIANIVDRNSDSLSLKNFQGIDINGVRNISEIKHVLKARDRWIGHLDRRITGLVEKEIIYSDEMVNLLETFQMLVCTKSIKETKNNINMSNKEMLKNKLLILYKEAVSLKEEFTVWRLLHDRTQKPYYAFFRIASDALGLGIISSLSRILINKDDLNIYYLINFINSNIKLFKVSEHSLIRGKNQTFINDIDGLLIKDPLESFRDKSGSHIDRHLANEGKKEKLYVNLNHIREAIDKIINLLEFYIDLLDIHFSMMDRGDAESDLKKIIDILDSK